MICAGANLRRVGKAAKNKRTQRTDKKVAATGLGGVAGRRRGAGGVGEDGKKRSGTQKMLGDTAESPPQERRNSPHAAVPSWLAVEVTLPWDIPEMGCCRLISKERVFFFFFRRTCPLCRCDLCKAGKTK